MTDLQLLDLLRSAAAHTRRQPPPPPPDNDNAFPPPPPPPAGLGKGRILREIQKSGELSQTALADALGIRPQSLSEALCKLEADGLISRTPSETDRRIVNVSLTQAGLCDIEEHRHRRESFAADYFSALSDEEKLSLADILSKLMQGDKKL